jgi:CTP:molybdopterin cytidylyltransferase MocA
VRFVEHEHWDEGMGSSIAAGARAASEDAVLVLTCDQPGVDAALLAKLVDAMHAGYERVACAYSGVVGVPALFSAAADLEALRSLSGEQGARRLLRSDERSVLAIPAEQAGHDIDDEKAWRRWRASAAATDESDSSG